MWLGRWKERDTTPQKGNRDKLVQPIQEAPLLIGIFGDGGLDAVICTSSELEQFRATLQNEPGKIGTSRAAFLVESLSSQWFSQGPQQRRRFQRPVVAPTLVSACQTRCRVPGCV